MCERNIAVSWFQTFQTFSNSYVISDNCFLCVQVDVDISLFFHPCSCTWSPNEFFNCFKETMVSTTYCQNNICHIIRNLYGGSHSLTKAPADTVSQRRRQSITKANVLWSYITGGDTLQFNDSFYWIISIRMHSYPFSLTISVIYIPWLRGNQLRHLKGQLKTVEIF